MGNILILNARIVNEGKIIEQDLLIQSSRIEKIDNNLSSLEADLIIDANEQYLLPGLIDDQVHFREPGLTHKGDIYSESKAAIAGGITSYMEMPNTIPPAVTQELLEEKYLLASKKSLANFSFYMGTTNENIAEVLKTDPISVCGVKIFMGSSTGNMLVDHEKSLERIFSECEIIIATHCEDEKTIKANEIIYKKQYGEEVPVYLHPQIRNTEACYLSSSLAVSLAKKHNTRLHILHISTQKELELFDTKTPLVEKRITSEACIHHLWFNDQDYEKKGTLIKWNPAIKSRTDQEAVLGGILNNSIDVIATDHAPHTFQEKQNNYFNAPSGGPMVQHGLPVMLELHHQQKISLEKIVEKMCHNPAIIFQIKSRGFIREGYFADLVLVNLNKPWTVDKNNLLYKCGWSPLEGLTFQSSIAHTIVSGHLAFSNGKFDESVKGFRMEFDR